MHCQANAVPQPVSEPLAVSSLLNHRPCKSVRSDAAHPGFDPFDRRPLRLGGAGQIEPRRRKGGSAPQPAR